MQRGFSDWCETCFRHVLGPPQEKSSDSPVSGNKLDFSMTDRLS